MLTFTLHALKLSGYISLIMPKIPQPDVRKTLQALAAAIPNPQTELNFTNNFTLLVAVVLSAQATDISVNKATSALFTIANSPHKMLELGEEGLTNYIKSIGLYRSKARNIITLSQQLLDLHAGEVPSALDQLTALAGVGIKTAKVIQNCAFALPTIAVDTHVHRLANRLGWVKTSSPLATQKIIEDLIPTYLKQHAHHLLILHGRYCCKARKPECQRCPTQKWCTHFSATTA